MITSRHGHQHYLLLRKWWASWLAGSFCYTSHTGVHSRLLHCGVGSQLARRQDRHSIHLEMPLRLVDLTKAGWFVFVVLMIAFLAKDFLNGGKLLYHSSKNRHTIGSRIRYFIGGLGLFSITAVTLFVSCRCDGVCHLIIVFMLSSPNLWVCLIDLSQVSTIQRSCVICNGNRRVHLCWIGRNKQLNQKKYPKWRRKLNGKGHRLLLNRKR